MVHQSRIWRYLSKLAAWLRRARGHAARQPLRADGAIRCIRQRHCNSKLPATTLHSLGFEMAQIAPAAPLAETANCSMPSPESGDGAVSNLRGEPSPIWRPTRLQPTGEKPVINQERTSARKRTAPFLGPKLDQTAALRTGVIEVGAYSPATAIAARMPEANPVTQSHLSAETVERLTTRSETGQEHAMIDPDRVMVAEPSPEFGDGKQPEPSPESGEGPISNLGAEPSPAHWRETCN